MMMWLHGIRTLKNLSAYVAIRMASNLCLMASSFLHSISIVLKVILNKHRAFTIKIDTWFRRDGHILPSQREFTCSKEEENVWRVIYVCAAVLLGDTSVLCHQHYRGLQKPVTLPLGLIQLFILFYLMNKRARRPE